MCHSREEIAYPEIATKLPPRLEPGYKRRDSRGGLDGWMSDCGVLNEDAVGPSKSKAGIVLETASIFHIYVRDKDSVQSLDIYI